jgi:formyl-CoA transferase|tara:strand:- start:798 stop:2069 length:1272 start_codon:yes stop_codon:yes gene_type:complete
MPDLPLQGIRILSMEQAAALPFATRHLADLGAEVIRVQSHKRPAGAVLDGSLCRNKSMLGLDLATPQGATVFLKLAAACDVVAHNFTPRVMHKYGIDYEGVKAVNENVIYCSLTGFGSTGQWADRPLYGPGAEAMSGQNLMIGEPEALTPGRPGTITYADNICGLNLVFAILVALERRDLTSCGEHIDISLYETGVCQVGAAIAEHSFGAPLPQRSGNQDVNYAIHGVIDTRGEDRHIAIAVTDEQLGTFLDALALDSPEQLPALLKQQSCEEITEKLQAAGIAASPVADAADVAGDAHLWSRQHFGFYTGDADQMPQFGPAWGDGGELAMQPPRHTGADNSRVLGSVAGYSAEEISALTENGTVGKVEPKQATPTGSPTGSPIGSLTRPTTDVRIKRGELSRVDVENGGWRAMRKHKSNPIP